MDFAEATQLEIFWQMLARNYSEMQDALSVSHPEMSCKPKANQAKNFVREVKDIKSN
jgi:hypothetical protein